MSTLWVVGWITGWWLPQQLGLLTLSLKALTITPYWNTLVSRSVYAEQSGRISLLQLPIESWSKLNSMCFNMVSFQTHILPKLLMNCNFLLYSYYKRLTILSQPQYLWSAEQESNPHSRGRSSMFYPLNYRQYFNIWWRWQDLNPLPWPCKGPALPDELHPQISWRLSHLMPVAHHVWWVHW